jgi:hypothetical protein
VLKLSERSSAVAMHRVCPIQFRSNRAEAEELIGDRVYRKRAFAEPALTAGPLPYLCPFQEMLAE